MATYTVNSPGSSATTFPTVIDIGDVLEFNRTSTGRTGTILEWVVPVTGRYRVSAVGAGGGKTSGSPYREGYGARMVGEFTLTIGDKLKVLVGQKGGNASGSNSGSGGGGGTFVSLGNNAPLIVAGGGGGGGRSGNYTHGDGGDATATNGGDRAGSQAGQYGNGRGAGFSVNGDAQSFVSGGTGGARLWDDGGDGGFGGGAGNSGHLGGGGGGYTGGSGGYLGTSGRTNGTKPEGGGSYNAGENQTNQAAFNIGHGKVEIEVLYLEYPIEVNLNVNNKEVHNENVIIEGTVEREEGNKEASYKIAVNGVDYIRWKGFKETPFEFRHEVPNNLLQQEVNEIRVDVRETSGVVTLRKSEEVGLINKEPEVNVEGRMTVREGALPFKVMVTDEDGDRVRYKVKLNDGDLIEWSDYQRSEERHYVITNPQLMMGENTLTIEAEDDYHRLTGRTVKEVTIVKEGSVPEIQDLKVLGNEVHALIEDAEGDDVLYEVSYNGEVIKPYDIYVPTPVQVKVKIPKHLIEIDEECPIKIEVKDRQWNTIVKEETFRVGYAGIMFQDERGRYYSTDLGEILRRLVIESVLAGEISPIYKVYLNNTTGYDLKDVTLVVDHHELQEELENVQLSKEEDPFEPKDSLVFDRVNYNEIVPFYVRLKTASESAYGGVFKIKVHAKPIR